ncbi:MAG: OsmC family protein [Litorilinea sp.]
MSELQPYLTRKAQVLAQRRTELQADPSAAKVRLTVSSEVAGNTGVRPVQMGAYRIASDSAPGLAGHSLGPSSPEMLLGALASCLVHTYLLQAALLDIPLDHIAIEVEGALDMTGVVGLPANGPIALESLAYTPTVRTGATAAQQAQLHAAVEQTCAVLNTLRSPMTVTAHHAAPAPDSTKA